MTKKPDKLNDDTFKSFVQRTDSETTEPEEKDEEAPMFQNKYKRRESGPKVRMTMGNGWSNVFMPGQEIKDPNEKTKSIKNKYKNKKENEAEDSKEDNTDTTHDDDEGSSSSEDKEDDGDYIYYFDEIKGIVGKISRTACLGEGLILSTTKKNQETYEGVIDHWEPKRPPQGGEPIPGKMDLIDTMKEVLRGRARDKIEGLVD